MVARAAESGAVVVPERRRGFAALLWLVTLLALALRLWWLDVSPPGLFTDEAAVAYNAYSIALTGRDEYGEILPPAFRSFGDYKRPAYVYFSAPFVAALGLTPFSARLPGAVLGTLCIPLVYVVGRRLLGDRGAALGAAALLAISPWAVHLSRAGHEASSFLPPAIGMVAALLAALHAPSRRAALFWSIVAAVALLLSAYGYHSGVIVAPLLAVAVLASFGVAARRLPRAVVVTGLLIAGIGLLPLLQQVRDGRATARAAQISLLSQGWIAEEAAARAARHARDLPPVAASVATAMDSRWAILSREAVAAYLAHFSPSFLFTRGDAEPRHHPAGLAQLHLWEAPLALVGLAALARGWHKPGHRVVGWWLLLAPLPAALAENAPHALRSFGMAPPLALTGALGAVSAWRWLQNRIGARAVPIGTAVGALLLAVGVGSIVKSYARDVPLEQDRAWSSGWHEAFAFAHGEVEAGRARRIVVPPEVREGYVFALVSSRYNPREYLAQGGSVVTEDWPLFPEPGPLRFTPWEVRVVDWEREPRAPDTLYVLGSWNERPRDARVVTTTRGTSGREALVVLRLG